MEQWFKFIINENWKLQRLDTEQTIKQKYQDLIFSKYSLTDQLNMSQEALSISASAQFDKRDFTEDEIVRLTEIQEAKKWIDEQRANCQEEINLLNN